MTDAEFDALLKAAQGRQTRKKPSPGKRFGELLRFLRLTGARPGEAGNLQWDNVDCDAGVIVLPKHKTVRTQRVPKPRVIVADSHRRHRDHAFTGWWLFEGAVGLGFLLGPVLSPSICRNPRQLNKASVSVPSSNDTVRPSAASLLVREHRPAPVE